VYNLAQTYSSNFQFDRNKFKKLILYICARADPTKLGAVKLNKVLYFVDMVRFAATGTPITGSPYRKRPYGPTSDAVLPMLRELEREGSISIEEMNYFGYRKKVYITKEKQDATFLSADEAALVEDAIDFVCYNNTAKTISELSHNRAWEMVEFGEEIPYYTAIYLFPSIVSEEAIEWANSEAERIEAQRSKGSTMDYVSLRDFRSKMAERDRK
jgi:Antitoxin SocA-like, Panacea domain